MSPITAPQNIEFMFTHVRAIVSVILGLSIGKLLEGLATFVVHPKRHKVSAVYLLWVAWALVSVLGFWWWKYRLHEVT